MGFFLHMPFFVYWLIVGMIMATALVLIHDRWPKWFKIVAFLFTVALPPFTAVGWLLYAAVLRGEKPEVK